MSIALAEFRKSYPDADFPHPLLWAVRYRNFLYYRFEQIYLRSPDRDIFLAQVKSDLAPKIARVAQDSYLSAISAIWSRWIVYQQKFSLMSKELLKCRDEYYQIHTAGIDARELFDLEDIDPFVEEDEMREIIKLLVTSAVHNYYLSVVNALQIARKRGGLREREEMAIMNKAKVGEKMDAYVDGSEIGFKWSGIKQEQRIEALYDKLRHKGFINKQTTLEDLKMIFSDKPVTNRVTWLKTSKQLLLFIETFLNKELIHSPETIAKQRKRVRELSVAKARGNTSQEQESELRGLLHEINHWLYPRIAACFKNKKGVPYSSKTLKHTRNDMFNKQKYPKIGSEFENLAVELIAI